ncbi:phenylalanine 4-monooxygenase [Moraxella sp. Tifton1]|uniref:phenylalanine 4-monooxygenase n=1 Tax=Moraxella oculi TaxID=2940516 RepID=A0ABW8U974_9GAMM|nr:phenylalanine 4-monooxygenase [Moraxella sp. Tifton1]MCL1623745.1 phenylalanine 4-monooxygenase [Moraxella sp. Tifton1]
MQDKTPYKSHKPDDNGLINWSADENSVWHDLQTRQQKSIVGRAYDEYLNGLTALNLPIDRIPQLPDLDAVLKGRTGWQTAPVPALISFGKFFELLANQKFPVATFIRTREDFDYIQEPDIFHEIVGHLSLLTHPDFANFTHIYGKLGLQADKKTRVFLARLYWFTMEFGLINTKDGLRIYGGGILSSPAETEYAVSGKPEYRPFNVNDILRTPYRIDKIQPIYYVIDNPEQLFSLTEKSLMAEVNKAMEQGLFEPHPSLLDDQTA